MADLEARREARRKRILESSEDRLNRVLGKPKENTSPEGTPAGDLSSNAAPVERVEQAVPTECNNDDINTTVRQRKLPVDGHSTPSTDRSAVPAGRNTVRVSPLHRPISTRDNINQNESLNTSRSTSEAKMMLKHFEFLRIVLCFVVAFLCRKVLVSGYGVFYIQSVVLPFLCMEAGFFMFKKKVLHNVILPHRSSMLISVLMLCGIKAHILTTYNKLMGYMTAAGEDFAMFFFAFMMSHLFVT